MRPLFVALAARSVACSRAPARETPSKAHPAPMPPRGGSSINDQPVCAVAAYVYSLSHQ